MLYSEPEIKSDLSTLLVYLTTHIKKKTLFHTVIHKSTVMACI